MKSSLLVCLALALIIAVRPVSLSAQPQLPEMRATTDANDVEVGQPFTVMLNVSADSSAPSASDPLLTVPNGVRANGPSVSTQTQISFINGHLTRKTGITAAWTVTGLREGVYVIGPPSVSFNGQRLQANILRVTVHAAGSGIRPRRGPAPSPFDPFGMFPRLPGFEPPEPAQPEEPAPDPLLSLDAPLDTRVFLRSIIDEKNPVVGQQVTLTVYVYARSAVEPTELHEPSVPDFFRRDLLGPNPQQDARVVAINGVTWRAQTIYKSALFPLRSGDLEIGPEQATFITGGASGPLARQSQRIQLHVGEPPARGRPVGYQIGDVGNYALTASVEPRTAEVGGAVAVTVTLGGVGNVPSAIRVPSSSSVEWLEPQVRDNIEVENGKVRGSRTFVYVVRPKKPGTVELGAVTLPYWDSDRKVYDIARAALGRIEVTAAPPPVAGKEPAPPHDPWSSLGSARDKLGEYRRPREPLTDRPIYWLGIFGAPFALVAGSFGARSFSRARRFIAARQKRTERGIAEALAESRSAAQKGDRATATSQLERALYLAVERATALKARALLVSDLPKELEQRGVPVDLATDVAAVLSAIETFRFAPDGAPDQAELAERAAAVVRRLGRLVPRRSQPPEG